MNVSRICLIACAALLAGAFGSLAHGEAALPPPEKVAVYERAEVATVEGDGFSFEVNLEEFTRYVVEFDQSALKRTCVWKIGDIEMGTTKSGRKWTHVHVPFEATSSGATKVHFTLEALDGDKPCPSYKLRNIKIEPE